MHGIVADVIIAIGTTGVLRAAIIPIVLLSLACLVAREVVATLLRCRIKTEALLELFHFVGTGTTRWRDKAVTLHLLHIHLHSLSIDKDGWLHLGRPLAFAATVSFATARPLHPRAVLRGLTLLVFATVALAAARLLLPLPARVFPTVAVAVFGSLHPVAIACLPARLI